MRQPSDTTDTEDMVHIPGTARLQSSIAAPTALPAPNSKRDAYYSGSAFQSHNGYHDPLDGSLGPFLASCALIFIVLLVVVSVLWGIHRRMGTRLTLRQFFSANVSVAESDSCRTSLTSSAAPHLQVPPNRLRIRSPIQRLKLLRFGVDSTSSTAIPLWTSPKSASSLAVPSIVVSRASPVFTASPSLTTSVRPSMSSLGSLEVPGAKRTAARPAPLIQVGPPSRSSSLQMGERQQPRMQAKLNSPSKNALLLNAVKKAKNKALAGKENQPPILEGKPSRGRKIFGSRYVHFMVITLWTTLLTWL